MDCNKCLHKCRAVCCGAVPIPRETLLKHEDKINPGATTYPLEDDQAIVVTEDIRCAFLDEANKCKIYEDRPKICRLFGRGGNVNLECPYQAPDGRIRPRQERRQIERAVGKYTKIITKRLERAGRNGN